MYIQEKFQVIAPGKIEAGEEWVDVKSVRHDKAVTKFNVIPPTGLEEPIIEQHGMPLSVAGMTDVTQSAEPEDLLRGFDKHDMTSIDEEYTGEHQPVFYDDVGGFVERANVLDRH